jgi:hypothetical protein
MRSEAIIDKQKEICSAVVVLFDAGKLCLTEEEQRIVLIMNRTNKCLRDWHLAILKTFLLRASD